MTEKLSKPAHTSDAPILPPTLPAKVSMDSVPTKTALSTADKNNNPDFTRRPNESFGPARKLTPYEMIMTSPLRKSGPRTSSHTHTNTGTATKTSKPTFTTAYSLSESQPAPTADGKAIARSNPPSCPPSHFIITSTSEIGILDEIDEMIREDQESILAQEYEENYKLQLSDKNFHENEKSLHLFSEKFELNLLRLEYIGLDNDEIPFPFRQHIAAANAAAIQSKTLTQQPQRQHQLESKLPSPSASLSTSPSDEPTDLPSLTPSGTPSLSPYIDFSDVPYKVLSVTPNTPKVSSPPHDTVSSTSPKPSSSENAVFDKDNPSINKINSVSSSSSIDETNTASSYSSHDDNNNHNTDHSSSPSYYTNKENAVFDDDDPFPVHIYSSLSSSNFTTKENDENATFEDDDPTNNSHSFTISPSISSSLCEYHHHFT